MNDSRNGRGFTRRQFGRGLVGAAGLAALARLGRPAFGAPPGRKPFAKAVIELWMAGGPSHLDTFDPKPDAGPDYCGPLIHPIETSISGVRICELLPLLAKQADKLAILRTMTHGIFAHETAAYAMQTGRLPGSGERSMVFPSFGAVVSTLRGPEYGYKGKIPPYVVLTRPQGRFAVEGFLGLSHKPFVTGGDPRQTPFAVEGIVLKGVSRTRQQARRDLLESLDTLGRTLPDSAEFARADRCQQQAYDLILGSAGKVFDLTEEKDAVRDRYGRTTFGQSCLVARRLVEAGVPYVTVNSGGWDTHKRHFEAMRQKLPDLDQGMSALLDDLQSRGLLDSTIVWWSGEFGRTPRVMWGEPWNGGRGHWGSCFSSVVAGGGFRGGVVVGESDPHGEQVAKRPIHPSDLFRAMAERLGIDPDAPIPNPRGFHVPVQPPAEKGPGRGRLVEIL